MAFFRRTDAPPLTLRQLGVRTADCYRPFLPVLPLDEAPDVTCENEETGAADFGLSAFGFFFSRLLFCSPLAMVFTR